MLLSARRHIDRPASEVFEFFADAANNPQWQRGMKSCAWTTPQPIGIGARYRQTASFLGRPIESVFEVTEYEPGQMIRIETVESTFPIQVTRTVEPVDGGSCTVTAHITGGPNVPGFLEPFLGRMAQRSVDRDYDQLVLLLGSRNDT